MSKQQLKERGFTIIEVVLVLAIAALIFLMVFVALPALQASQRDSARKSDVSIVSAAVNSYTSNNKGSWPPATAGTAIPSTGTGLVSYVTDVSPNTNKLIVLSPATGTQTSTPKDGEVIVYPAGKCGDASGASVTIEKGTTRQYAVTTKLESGNGAAYCLEA